MSRLSDSSTEDFLCAMEDLLREGLGDNGAFDAKTRSLLADATEDNRAICFLLVARALVLGPRANVNLDRPSGEWALLGHLASLGARKLHPDTSADRLRDIAIWCVVGDLTLYPPPDITFSSFGNATSPIRIGFEGRVSFAFGRISDWNVETEALRMARDDPRAKAYALRYLLDARSGRVRQLAKMALYHPSTDESLRMAEAAIQCLADSWPQMQRYVLSKARDPRLPVDRRVCILSTVGQVMCDTTIPALAEFRTSPDPEIRAAAMEALSHAPDSLLEASLVEAEGCVRSESDALLRAKMIDDLACGPRRERQRRAILRSLAESDSDPVCREKALQGASRLDLMVLGSDWAEGQ